MTSSHFKKLQTPLLDTKEAAEGLRFALCKVRCRQLMETWFMMTDFHELEEWFESSQCCFPLSLAKLLDHRIIEKAMKE